MSMVIHIGDDLAFRLQAEAANRSLSAEALAVKILHESVPRCPEGWGARNQRRLELIRKSARCELSEREQAELDELQSCLDEMFASFDAGLHQQLTEMQRVARQLAAESSHD